jgi:predicted dehydrogenase
MNRYRVAVLGTSFGRNVQVPGFRSHPGFEVVAIAGRDAARTARIAADLGVAGAYADWRELLQRESPDLVSIATPVVHHHPMMLGAIAAGAHVLCEKPTAMDRFQAAEMRDAALAAKRVAGINHEFRFLPARAYVRRLVREGAIGRPRRAAIIGRYPLWATPASRGPTWLSDASQGGGILGALGSHHIDALRSVLGEPARARGSVRVDQPRRGPVAPGEPEGLATADDACTFELEFGGGATGLVDLSACAPYRWERHEVQGEEATLRWDESGLRLWRLAPGREPEELPIPAVHAIESREGEPALLAPFRMLVGRLHRAIDAGEPLEPSFAVDAVAVQSVIDAVRESSRAGAWAAVRVPGPGERRER